MAFTKAEDNKIRFLSVESVNYKQQYLHPMKISFIMEGKLNILQ